MSERWAEWLRVRRDGGSPEKRQAPLAFLAPICDRVLDGADLSTGDVLLDVGCGDGLIGLGALERGARVIFSDSRSTASMHAVPSLATQRSIAALMRPISVT